MAAAWLMLATVHAAAQQSPPILLSHPADSEILERNSALFQVEAIGTEPISYQWRRNGYEIPGETLPRLILDRTRMSDDAARFDAVVSNPAGVATSQVAVLTVRRDAAPQVVIYYDDVAGPYNYGRLYVNQFRNLLGHFHVDIEARDVAAYQAGDMDDFDASFYIGSAFDAPLPDTFLADAAIPGRTLVWINYNIWKLLASGYDVSHLGFSYAGLLTGYNRVAYKGENLYKGTFDFEAVHIVPTAVDEVYAEMYSATDAAKPLRPYALRSGSFWYFADNCFTDDGDVSRSLVLADLLHEILATGTETSHRALVRIEDLNTLSSPSQLAAIADLLQSRGIRGAFGVIPRNISAADCVDTGDCVDLALSDDPDFQAVLVDLVAKGHLLLVHGYTHNNVEEGEASGPGYEFWNHGENRPLSTDTWDFAADRVLAARAELQALGLPARIWETPHYEASLVANHAIAAIYSEWYERLRPYNIFTDGLSPEDLDAIAAAPPSPAFQTQHLPFTTYQSVYGPKVLPENLHFFSEDWFDGYGNAMSSSNKLMYARHLKVVRDGVASFYFHPFLDISILENFLDDMEANGYVFTDAETLLDEMPAGWSPTPASPMVLAAPENLTVDEGGAAVFTAAVSGSDPLLYQWRRDGIPIDGADGTRLILDPVVGADRGLIDVVLQNGSGSVTSAPALLAVNYPVTYVANGATGGMAPAAQTQIHDVALALASNSGNLVRTGHSFAGWNTAADGSGTDYAAGASYMANVSVTLYAHWIVDTYPVAYAANGATNGSAPSAQTKTYDVALILASNSGNLERTGYTFAGWNTAADGSGTDYGEGASYTTNAPVTLYAQWTLIIYPVLLSHPEDSEILERNSALFLVEAIGTGPISYQWRRNGYEIPGETLPRLILDRTRMSDDAARFDVIVSSPDGVATSQVAVLTVRRDAAPQVVIYYDDVAGPYNYGRLYVNQFRNLLGHFHVDIEARDVAAYQAGDMDAVDASFYIGSAFDAPLPDTFLADAAIPGRTLVWINYNIWKLLASGYDTSHLGFSYTGIVHGYNRVSYKGENLYKGTYDFEAVHIVATDVDQVYADMFSATDPLLPSRPYAVRSGSFWYFADNCFTDDVDVSRSLVLADLLHDILDSGAETSHRVLVRIEDINAYYTTPTEVLAIADMLQSRGIRASFGIIPRYISAADCVDTGDCADITMSDDPGFQAMLGELVDKGHLLLVHGYTHNNIEEGEASGPGYEFWNHGENRPLSTDTWDFAADRVLAARAEFLAAGLPARIWETPHYEASLVANHAIAAIYSEWYERLRPYNIFTDGLSPEDLDAIAAAPPSPAFQTQYLPYTSYQSVYGTKVVPENLNFFSDDWFDSYGNPMNISNKLMYAHHLKVVRDGVASFYFHPYQGISILESFLDQMDANGYVFTDAETLLDEMPAGWSPTPAAPVILAAPEDLTVDEGDTAVFTAAVSGSAPLLYQWRRDGIPIDGADGTRLILDPVVGADRGLIDVVLQNGSGSVTSAPALLTVNYPVIYVANGATGGMAPAAQTQIHDVALALASNSGNLARTGYSFGGWNTAADGSGTDYAVGASYMANVSVTLYAHWIADTYPVAYAANGATNGSAPSAQTKTYDVTLILAGNSGNLARTGYTFAGWNSSADGSGTDYAPGGSYTANAPLTLYAKWTILPYTLSEAVNSPALILISGGDAEWFGQEDVSRDGLAVQSGAITHDQLSWMETTVTGPGMIRFWWKVSSEADADELLFLVDGVVQDGAISGDVDWERQEWVLPAGNWILRWTYAKDGAGSSGDDRGWVDQVAWFPGSDWDLGYEDLGGGWRRLHWFGDYVPTGSGWFWHNRHGYFFPRANSVPSRIFFYTMDMGWLFTHSTRYPYLYRFSDQSWLWYLPGSQSPRWFINLTAGLWEAKP